MQILTIPNLFTTVRAVCIPIFVWLLVSEDAVIEAAWLLGGLGATDWVDGYLARRLDQGSKFGSVFDPVTDRILFLVAVPLVGIFGGAPRFILVLTLIRELAVIAIAIAYWVKRKEVLKVSLAGKTGAFFLFFAFPMFLGGVTDVFYAPFLEVGAWILIIPGLAFGYWSVVSDYWTSSSEISSLEI